MDIMTSARLVNRRDMGDWITREEAEELEGLIWALNNVAIEGNELAIYLLSRPTWIKKHHRSTSDA